MEDLLGDLNGALVNPSGKVLHRDKLWESYFYVCSKETFINHWNVFLCTTNSPAGSPVLYQHLTDLVFKALLHSEYSVMVNDTENISSTHLTYNEVNALRYAAGYVCRHIRKKIEVSSHPLKEEMVLSLMTMVKEKYDTTSGPCEVWTDLIDQGGLWHIQENTHSFCLCLEEVCVHLQSLLTETNKKEEIIQDLIDNENVQFYWLIVGADFEEDNEAVLLRRIVELFVMMSGFSYASAWLEKYKQGTKKGTQKSKSLRKKIN